MPDLKPDFKYFLKKNRLFCIFGRIEPPHYSGTEIVFNDPPENFFGMMKNEMFYGNEYEFKTLEQLQKAMEDYIEYFNNERVQVKLKGLTPCQTRNQSLYSFK